MLSNDGLVGRVQYEVFSVDGSCQFGGSSQTMEVVDQKGRNLIALSGITMLVDLASEQTLKRPEKLVVHCSERRNEGAADRAHNRPLLHGRSKC